VIHHPLSEIGFWLVVTGCHEWMTWLSRNGNSSSRNWLVVHHFSEGWLNHQPGLPGLVMTVNSSPWLSHGPNRFIDGLPFLIAWWIFPWRTVSHNKMVISHIGWSSIQGAHPMAVRRIPCFDHELHRQGYWGGTLWLCQNSYWSHGPVEIVNFPMKHCEFVM